MRTKFLSVIASFLFLSLAFSACLDSEDNYEFSSDASVYAFGIDTIHGKYYKFSIDQVNRRIFNLDSLPLGADTILDSIVVDTFTVSGTVTSGQLDTVFSIDEPVDLRPAINSDEGMSFKIYANDGLSTRIYKLYIQVHKQDPDSLTWNEMNTSIGELLPTTPLANKQKVVMLGNDLLLYTYPNATLTVLKTSTATPGDYQWSASTVVGLPANVDMHSIMECAGQLYVATSSGDVYTSPDGEAWNKHEGLSGGIVTLLTAFPESLVAIKQVNGVNYYCTADVTTTSAELKWTQGDEVPAGFPTEKIYSTVFTTDNGINKALLVGMPSTEEGKTTPWFSMNGLDWGSLATTSELYCPIEENPSIFYYGGDIYALGSGLETFYLSEVGIAWQPVKKKFMLPASVVGKKYYSMTIDKNNFIWLLIGGESTGENQLWRGRLNRLGFERQ